MKRREFIEKTGAAAVLGKDMLKALAGFFPAAKQQLTSLNEPSTLDTSEWERWLRVMFPEYTTAPFAPRHRVHWTWVWDLKPGLRPRPLIDIWPRGGAKSTSAELTCPAVGALKTRSYVLYVSGTQIQADTHVATVSAMLESDAVRHHYHDLSQRELGLYGTPRGWRRNRLWTARGLIVDALGLESDSVRGLKAEKQRPDLIILDDVDARHDSLDTIAKKLAMIKDSILPAGSLGDCAVLGVQNLITKNSIFSRLKEGGGANFLLDRIVSGPEKAIVDWPSEPKEGVHYKKRGEVYFILTGTPSWEGQNLQICQADINTWGWDSFLREAQHEVDRPEPGKLFPMYDERFHVISRSQFVDFFGAYDHNGDPLGVPSRGYITRAQDWGTTHEHPMVNLWGWKPAEEMPLSDCFFIVGELAYPTSIYQGKSEFAEPVAPTPVGRAIVEWERANQIVPDRMKNCVMSHEASAACNTYNALSKYNPGYYNVRFGKWDAKRKGGIEEIQDFLTLRKTRVDAKGDVVPFRHPFNPELVGCPRLFLVVDDDQVQKARALDGRGLLRLRQEIPEYGNPATASGIEADAPRKYFDDAVDALRMMADVHWPRSERRTEEERINQEMPERFQKAAIEQLPEAEREQAIANSYYAYHKAKRKVEQADAPKSTRRRIREKYRSRSGRIKAA